MELPEATNFIEQFINEDIKSGKYEGRGNKICVRFPPEPNGYLHIGHVKALCINFGVKEKYNGKINLRMDDTNPAKEDYEYVNSIIDAVKWLGFDYDNLFFASDYYDEMYGIAEKYIREGNAYVCDLSADEITATRGTLTEAGKESPYRNRSVEENLQLFREMKEGKYPDGAKVLRAKIDMSSPNINMRDPVIYRIAHVPHYRQGDKWCIYPMYDFAHPVSDAIEGITHSLCSLEFENHRPLYDWVIEKAGFAQPVPRQIEFARLNITNTLMSKRYLKKLVDEGFVSGWDDPRMPTLMGLKNRGVPPMALRKFCADVGVAKNYGVVNIAQLDECVRDELNATAERAMAVTDPVKLTITNYDGEEELGFEKNPTDGSGETRPVKFTGSVYIERSDFALVPPPKFKRLYKGGTVRLKAAYIVRCDDVVLDESGEVKEILCTYFPETRSGSEVKSEIKAKGVIQWVDCKYGVDAEFVAYKPLLKDEEYPDQDYAERLNKDSINTRWGKVEPYAAESAGKSFQLMRTGYYKVCGCEGGKARLSEIVSLKDNFNK
ncbi:MAG: glutamine--tRNA ligase/YqeY domain fusion protein [Clostridiales bacterium]|nr:glutamine--tRNA ligase/YqeY domain fusion protein [Clostridiales bacterium]